MHFVTCMVLAWKVNARQLPTHVCASCIYFNSCLKALPGCESWCVFGLTRLAFGPSGMQTVWSVLTWLWFTSRRLRPVMLLWETWLNISHLLKLCAMGGCFFFPAGVSAWVPEGNRGEPETACCAPWQTLVAKFRLMAHWDWLSCEAGERRGVGALEALLNTVSRYSCLAMVLSYINSSLTLPDERTLNTL